MMRLPYNPGPYDDDWEDVPTGGDWQKHVIGLLVAGLLCGFGVYCLWTGEVVWPQHGGGESHLTGGLGRALAIALIGMGLVAHCHHY
jgi:hypothetical protein